MRPSQASLFYEAVNLGYNIDNVNTRNLKAGEEDAFENKRKSSKHYRMLFALALFPHP